MSGDTAFISLNRCRSVSYAFRGFAVQIDNASVDKIKSGEYKKYALRSGKHIIRVSIDFYKSAPVEVNLKPGQTLALECGDSAPKTLAESLSLKGLGKSLQSLTSPGDHLYIKLLTDSGQQTAAPKASNQAAIKSGRSPRPSPSSPRLFLSYRREDSRAITGRISDRLTQQFGRKAVFRDVDSIPLGSDFRNKIEESISQADIVLAIIGKQWCTLCDDQGRRRLELPEDFVRLEIESAMRLGIPVVPVLVEEADMPAQAELPQSIGELAYRNAIFIPREPYFHAGVDKLIEELQALHAPDHEPVAARTAPRFCTGCGTALLQDQKFCTQCGKGF